MPSVQGKMQLCIWDVEHGACAMLQHVYQEVPGRLAMIDSGRKEDWRPSTYIKDVLKRNCVDYLLITNADQDHINDLEGLARENIRIKTLSRNPHPPAEELRKIKAKGGLSKDIERYLHLHGTYNQPAEEPFNEHMGSITQKLFFNKYPNFTDTNNLSCVFFIEFGGFKIVFPGDLEYDGWLELLTRQDFRDELSDVDVLVASHHGRRNGYCEDVFDYCRPRAIVMSDKAIVHDTQNMTQIYRQRVIDNHPSGVKVSTTMKQRRVLTTRKDGSILFSVDSEGNFTITTEKFG